MLGLGWSKCSLISSWFFEHPTCTRPQKSVTRRLKIKTEAEVKIKAKAKVKIKAKVKVRIKAEAEVEIEADPKFRNRPIQSQIQIDPKSKIRSI